MKTKLFFLAGLALSLFFQAQNVTIPDAKFKSQLVGNNQINTNGDTEIQVSEAAAFTGTIAYSGMGITDLTGIEAFVKLTQLYIGDNLLTSLNLSSNTALKTLICDNNKITSLNFGNNMVFDHISCNNNKLKNLDVSKNTVLRLLFCNGNELTSLNLKNGNIGNILAMEAKNNPSLACIQVDNITTATSNSNWKKDATASYNTSCNSSLSTVELGKEKVNIYPNPVQSIANFSVIADVEIYNTAGQKVLNQKSTSSSDLSKLAKGIYIVILKDKNGKEIQKGKIIKN